MPDGTVRRAYHHYRGGWETGEKDVIEEASITVFVNSVEWVVLMATPLDQVELALGLLNNEGIIDGLGDVRSAQVNEPGTCVDVWLNPPAAGRLAGRPPERRVITSGCGGGARPAGAPEAAAPAALPDGASPTLAADALGRLFRDLQGPDSLHTRAGGTHTAGLADGEHLLLVREDVGRHNAIDKVCGACLQRGLDTRGKVLLSTGRISSDMLRKAARMGCPIVASRTSPTSLAIELAEGWNITLAGYVRQGALSVYSHASRIRTDGLDDSSVQKEKL
jgi:FdhD protein